MTQSVLQRAMLAVDDAMRRLGFSKGAGTGAGQVVVLNATAKLPAVDGSNLINLPSAGGLPPGADVEVEADGDLVTDIGANTALYLSGDVDVASEIAITDERFIYIAHGTTITAKAALGSDKLFNLSPAARLKIFCDGEFTILGESGWTGNVFADNAGNQGRLDLKGKMIIDAATNNCNCNLFSGVGGVIEEIEIRLKASSSKSMSGGSVGGLEIGSLILVGGDSSTLMAINNMTIKTLHAKGTWRAYSSSVTSDYALQLATNACVGTLKGHNGLSSGFLVWQLNGSTLDTINNLGSDTIRSAVRDGTAGPRMTNEYGAVIPHDSSPENKVFLPYSARSWVAESGAASYTLFAPGITQTETLDNLSRSKIIGGMSPGALTMASTFLDNDIIGYDFDGGLTLSASSVDHRFTNVYFDTTFTVPSGALCSFVNCRFAALTVSAGASSKFTNCEITGALTNSDGFGSRFSQCRNASGETWMNNDKGIIEFKPTSTTDATKTQLFIDASSLQFLLNSNDVAQCSLKVTSVRDNQNEAVFYVPVFVAKNDGGTTTVSAPGTLASLTPDKSSGTGVDLRLDIEADDTNDAPAPYITANASENWDHKAELTALVLNN